MARVLNLGIATIRKLCFKKKRHLRSMKLWRMIKQYWQFVQIRMISWIWTWINTTKVNWLVLKVYSTQMKKGRCWSFVWISFHLHPALPWNIPNRGYWSCLSMKSKIKYIRLTLGRLSRETIKWRILYNKSLSSISTKNSIIPWRVSFMS